MPDVMELKAAVEKAIDVCIRDDVLAEFLRNNRSEAISVSIYEYDEERTMRQMREEAFEDGVAAAGASMIALIRKKKAKGRSVSEAADELELEAGYIRRVYDCMEAHGDWSDLEIARELPGAGTEK